jgi:hypothetical protein
MIGGKSEAIRQQRVAAAQVELTTRWLIEKKSRSFASLRMM